jgi:hypothetical protein
VTQLKAGEEWLSLPLERASCADMEV